MSNVEPTVMEKLLFKTTFCMSSKINNFYLMITNIVGLVKLVKLFKDKSLVEPIKVEKLSNHLFFQNIFLCFLKVLIPSFSILKL